MDWLKIGSAVLLLAMVVMVWPSAKYWLKNSPEASGRQWMLAIIPIGIVGLFIVLLVAMVQ